jgi:molybdate transport system ATP-binding protein
MADELTFRCRKRLSPGFELDCELRIFLDRSPVTVLFGPSGSGKTTLLRVLAGLERADDGEITFRGHVWFDSARHIHLLPQQRRAGFVFQDYALFPHLSVVRNVHFAGRHEKAKELLKAFGLAQLARRLPAAISGGQQQRVALARALAAEPDLLLLDEPLSALDASTRAHTRSQLRRILLGSAVPAIVVTHDRMEAIALGDTMAVMVAGRIRQFGPVQEVFRHPVDASVAATVGIENIVQAKIESREGGLATLAAGPQRLQCVDTGEAGPVFACIHAEDVTLAREPISASSARNRIPCRIEAIVPEGPLTRVELDCGFPLVAIVTSQSVGELQLNPGDEVLALIKTTSVHLTA